MEFITDILYFVYCLLCFVATIFIYGLLPPMRARKLKEHEIAAIKRNGITHKTNKKGFDGIMADRKLKGRGGFPGYSRQFRKCTFFFVTEYMNDLAESFNDAPKFTHSINIKNITDEQLKKMRIRRFDNALIVCGDFEFAEENVIIVEEKEATTIQKAKRMGHSIFRVLTSVSAVYQILSFLIGTAVVTGILVILYFAL